MALHRESGDVFRHLRTLWHFFKSQGTIQLQKRTILAWMYLLIHWSGIFTSNLSSHKFLNVIQYCKFYLVQKSKRMSLLRYLFRNWVQGDNAALLEHQMPLLHFCSHSYFISGNFEAAVTENLDFSPFIDLAGNGWWCVCLWGAGGSGI